MDEQEINDYKIKAQRKLDSGKLLYENGYYSESVTQFFYAMLLIAKALLLTRDYVTGKQKRIIDGINQIFVLKENFNKNIFKNFARTQDLRQTIDYEARDYITQEIAFEKMKECEDFIKECEKFF
ncbi:HEPN domain-containing protein (plasmid) [Methanosphaera sp. ISO3-F5]|uniref:HEPN domain-containing protein n=1 Tax=Methanosphaera sp. ISO3-F5 TaxID=1452353 RepID=UPI002B257785|nr:HEPN domain-containing protein [Methanosphaera sp. ISO3-F5]WQH65397.1 HEPN domain-containing protein [Methanosphaera sp. ISO3-F5]